MSNDSFWTVLSLRVAQEASETVGDLLQDITGNGITIEPPIEALGPDEGYVLDDKAPLTMRAYVYGSVTEAQRGEIMATISEAGLTSVLSGAPEWTTVRDEDWAEAWKEHYHIETVGRVVVRPLWREYEPKTGDVVVSLDPGMAFGTGQHPTTRMCIQALQDRMHAGDYVWDLGSGSGILAIVAVALGANRCIATDTEDQAVKMTIENVTHNAMSDRIETRPGSIEAVASDGPFDCIMANINAAAIASLAADMSSQLKPGGWLAAGGVIEEREGLAREALEAVGLRIEETMATGDWRTFIAYK